jgi:hypothetical protein
MNESEKSTRIPLSWERILHMLVLAVAYAIAETVLIALIIGQILFRVVSKEANEPMRRLGKQISGYLYEILLYLSFNSDDNPLPYRSWAASSEQRIIVSGTDANQQA